MYDFEEMEQKDIKIVIKNLAIEYKYKNGNEPIKNKNLDDRVAVKSIDNERLRKAIYYVPEAKFKVYKGNLGKNSYNVFIKRKLLSKIIKIFDLDLKI